MKEGKSTILIIDDIASNIYALENLLATDNRTFLQATSGNQGLKIALNQPVDLIILDVQMPEMDGFEVANMLKSNKRTKDIPILFASAEFKEQKNILKGLEEGAIDYLFKPLDPEITKAKVTMLIQLELQRKKLVETNNALEKSYILINNCIDIICTIDATTFEFDEFNVAMSDILGYTPKEISKHTLLFYLSDEDKIRVSDFKKSDEKTLSFETKVMCKDQSYRCLQWNILIKGEKWFSNARDITERKKKEIEIIRLNENLRENVIQLENSNTELESFSYSVSHDLRAPLRAINNYSQMLEESAGTEMNEKSLRFLGNIKRNATKMDHLIDDLLEFSRLGKKGIDKQPIELKELVQICLDEIPHANPNLTIKISDLPIVQADYSLLKQVMVNLLSNAIKYSNKKENPTIEVGTFAHEGMHAFYVKDNGVGFDMQYMDKLFGVFQRLHSNKEFEGTGVGLAIVKRIIEKHGGKVWAEAKIDEGATFFVTMPL
ncbi:ATP-binding protein [uncultured Cytophaga sp.]|uniref:sensor histidine kinase n=1 Tax=uncultured Cytophaga sp. TaxID=160238 RepID=UPI0026024640|nr:ATP-binding protein [uncultured Cytophaga sp.]